MHRTARLQVMAGACAALLILPALVWAAPVAPTSYSMLNGQTGTFSYHDETYAGVGATGNPNANLSPLAGGLGDLTNGVIPTQNWNIEETVAIGPYVGWFSIDPTITFLFGGTFTFNTVTVDTDDAGGFGTVFSPGSFDVTIGATTLNFPVPDDANAAPDTFVLNVGGLAGSSVILTVHDRFGPTSNNFMMVSEVRFDGTVPTQVPEPGTLALFGAGLVGLAMLRARRHSRP